MRCPHCYYENATTAHFCQEYGQRLHLRCAACGFVAPQSAKFCPECGQPLTRPALPADVSARFTVPQNYTPKHLAEKILTSRSALQGERKQVTVPFCDLANSTTLAERLGPEAMHTLLQRFFEISLNEVHRYEGTINQFLGDGFIALFGAPIAYEDHAPRAALAALGLQRRLRERLADVGQAYGVEFTVRMGLNTGLVVVGGTGDNLRMDYTAIGDTEKVSRSLRALGMDSEAWAPYLLHLLGVQEAVERLTVLSPEAIKARIFATLRQISLHGSQHQPIIFAVQDLHWSDKTSEACFAALVESLAGAPILFLATYRPGYSPPWLWQSYATQLALHHLAPQDSLTVVHAVVPQERLPEAVAQVILRKAEGNPFFLEELTRAVAERQALSPDVAIPDTIQGVITARIERLPDTPKRLLQAAAVLGRDVPWRLLEAIWEEPDTLEASLLELQRLEFFYEHVGVEDSVYVFTHALTQEVAYASLLISHRQALHAAAGRALEAHSADRLEDVYERLAYHYARTTEADKAVEYLTRAAEKAARGLAHAEVVAALEALQTFTAMSGRFEVGRTHLALADLAYAQENRAAAAQHLHQAHRLFVTLQVPRFVEQTAQRARAFAVWLAEESGGMGAHRH